MEIKLFDEWMKEVNREKENYPLFKGKELDERALFMLWDDLKTPIEALNDLSTAT